MHRESGLAVWDIAPPLEIVEKPKKTLPAIYRKAAEVLSNEPWEHVSAWFYVRWGCNLSPGAIRLWDSFSNGDDAGRDAGVLGLLLLAEILETADA